MSELRNLLERARNQPLRFRARQAANLALAVGLGGRWGLVHLVEYPKCGGSWIKNMLAGYIGSEPFFDDRLLRPRDVVHVHRLDKPWYRRVVVVTRDPRDMYVSTYYHETQFERREKNPLIERWFRHDPSRPVHEDFALYLEAKLSHVTHPPFMLREFVRSWRARPDAVWTRYEDCLARGEAELLRVAEALGLPSDPERAREVVEANRFANRTRARGKERRPGEADARSFERKGIAGDWRNHFGRRACEVFERYEGESLRALGYESDASWVDRFSPPAA
jgi:hypothetical protein